jgi:hypothetical protein
LCLDAGPHAATGELLRQRTELSGQSGNFSARLRTQAGANDHVAVMQGSTVILSNPTRWAAGNC